MTTTRFPIRWSRILVYGVLTLFAAFYLMPLYVVVGTSLKSFADVSLSKMWQLPRNLSLESFVGVWQGDQTKGFIGLKNYFLNSLYLTIPATILSTMIGSLNGYVLSKWQFKGSNIIFTLILFGMFIPYQSILIPLVVVLRSIGLYGSIPGLILTHIIYGIPITTLIFRNYYKSVPTDLVESAKIDGGSFFKIYRWVVFPISIPALAVVAIWQFTAIWNNYLFAVILTQNPKVQPITVGVVNLSGGYFVEWNIQMAAAFIAAFPPLLIYILLSRYFMKGLMAGSVKG